MPEVSNLTQRRVLDAAKAVFARYGFHKASMADIAREAGVSRPSLYQWYGNKRALFATLAAALASDALQAADAAWPPGAALAQGLPAAILAKDLPLFRLLHATPHGADLLTVDAALTSLLATALEQRFAALLADKLQAQDQPRPDLAAVGGADAFAAIVARLAGALKAVAADEADYILCVERLCVVLTAALRVSRS